MTGVVLLSLACGASAAPTPTVGSAPTATGAPASATAAPTPTAAPAATTAPAEPEVNPGKLTVMVGDFGSGQLDGTFLGGKPGGHNYGRILQAHLIATNSKMDMIPGIASAWSFSPDGLTWDFTIREGVKFHDGSTVTEQDVLWSLQHTFGPQSVEYASSTAATLARALVKIESNGPGTVSMSTAKPFTALPFYVAEAGPYWYTVMPKRASVHDPADGAAYDKKPIGAGVMRLTDIVPASMMKFERFDDYYYQPKNGLPEDKRVKFQSLDLVLVPEEATRVAALRAGDADIVPASLATRKQVEAGGGRMVFGQEGVTVQVKLAGCWDVKYPCHDKRVRQALNYALDKELIQTRLFGGPEVFQVKGWNFVSPSTVGYTPELDPWPFDADKARQLLADAGYPGGANFGKLTINTFPSTSLPNQVELAQLGADMWRRELGLDVEVKVGDSAAMQAAFTAQELGGQVYWRDNDARKDPTSILNSSYGDPKNGTRMHEDAELFRIVQETVQIIDPAQRAEASAKLFQRMSDENYEIGVGYANIPWGVSANVATWEPYPLTLYPSALYTVTLK